jgi:signal transduction histidine kinase
MNANDAISEAGTIEINTSQQNDKITIVVKDDGCGMSDNTINKLFDPFFTTKEVGTGTGLGLSISHKIIESHNGVISVSSGIGKGTVFTIELPVAS